jgi:hypothetical protein
MMELAKDVHLERMPREFFQAVTIDPNGSWKSYIQMYAEK